MEKETLEEFYDRSYANLAAYPPHVLVWKSKSQKEKIQVPSENTVRTRKDNLPEKWDMETTENYLKWLKN